MVSDQRSALGVLGGGDEEAMDHLAKLITPSVPRYLNRRALCREIRFVR